MNIFLTPMNIFLTLITIFLTLILHILCHQIRIASPILWTYSDVWHAGMGGETAQFLHNYGHEKLRLVEEVHQRSVWTVLPVNHILGKLLVSPTTCNAWSASKDEKTSYVWWTLPMACNWGRDKGYKLYRWPHFLFGQIVAELCLWK